MSILELASEITRDSFVGDGAGCFPFFSFLKKEKEKELIFQPRVHANLIG
jgi:hypothetical protein